MNQIKVAKKVGEKKVLHVGWPLCHHVLSFSVDVIQALEKINTRKETTNTPGEGHDHTFCMRMRACACMWLFMHTWTRALCSVHMCVLKWRGSIQGPSKNLSLTFLTKDASMPRTIGNTYQGNMRSAESAHVGCCKSLSAACVD